MAGGRKEGFILSSNYLFISFDYEDTYSSYVLQLQASRSVSNVREIY